MPFVNGQSYQHALIDLRAAGTGGEAQFTTFRSIDFSSGADKEGVADYQGQQISYTVKPMKTSGKFSLLQDEYGDMFYKWLLQQAAQLSTTMQRPMGIGQVRFDMTVTFGALLTAMMTRRLKGCLLNQEAFSSKDDQAALVMEFPLFITRIEDQDGKAFMEYKKK